MAEIKPFKVIMEIEPLCLHNEETHDVCMKATNARKLIVCKDCKHRPISIDEKDQSGFNLIAPNGETDYMCPCINEVDGYYSWMPDDDFFCANGERNYDNECSENI